MKNKVLIMLMGFFLFAHQLFAQDVSVSGNVKDEKGEALIGVSIQIKGTPTGNITDIDGNFTLSSVPANGELVFSYMGYETQTIPVKGKSVINVVLKEDSQALDEVVVVGFGTQKKVNLTGAVASVGAEVLENKPVANVGQALQGVVPNLNVSATNASPNATPSFNVRGGTSIGLKEGKTNEWEVKNGSPLIIIDGIQVDADYLNLMNPSDIENISVLKDASASAIYGARATYGVMLITTKSGKNDSKATVTYNMSLQWNTPSHTPDILNSYTHQLAANKQTEMTGGTVTPWMETLLAAKKKYIENPSPENAWIYNEGSTTNITWVANMNPYEIGVKDWTPLQRHNLSISGGSTKTRYYISLGYQRQEGMYKINTDIQNRYNINMNLNSKITDWFDVASKISFNTNNYNEPYMNPQKGSVWSAMKNEPGRNINMPIMTGPNDPIPDAYTDNILGWLAYGATQETKKTNTVFSVTPTITFCPEFNIKAELSYRPTEYFQKRFIPVRNYVVDAWRTVNTHTSPSSVREETRHSDYYTINAYANFNKSFGKHNVSAIAGFNQEWYKYRMNWGEAEEVITNDLPTIGMTSGTQYASDAFEHWAIRGAFVRANYDYLGRYLFEFSGRYDGTSRFGKDTRFQFFPSFSAGWRISEEQFMKNTHSWLDNLKIRGSWGSLGNQNVANYAYIASYGAANYISWVMDGEQLKGMNPTGLIARDLTWETAKTLDFGVDITTLNGRLDATFDWYTRRTTDILMNGTKLPAVLGATVPKRNTGELKTNGWELSLKWKDRLNNGIRYDVGFVLSDYQSEVIHFSGNPNSLLSTLYDGMKMGEIWGYETVGILQENDFTIDENGKYILNGPSQNKIAGSWYPGDIRYADLNNDDEISTGDNTLENPGDRKIIGNSTPRFQYGITGNISWKNFDLNIFFQGIGKKDVWISDNAFWGGSSSAGNWEMLNNSWTPERTNAKYPMYAGRGQNQQVQTGYLFNGAYLRLKTLALGYTLPKAWTNKAKLSTVRLSLSGYNLFEITQIPDTFDPDQISSAYPMMRSVAFGLQVGF
ncbi:TonB-dependent receptor [Parabacteroides sp. AM58-2XD]|uniref:SusC/RagA family TonB-linked outer membrane protein n=1 Tax=Parabacteroides TaxID=375288 RepID=UPI000FE1D78A|nr:MULTISPECIES: TonB-dependent receptor [Parabacteroides]RGY99345.1 TonB-dependent receptor [Parabacteroides sp. AM58-2XD]GKG73984.1 SusC/RagA family TonB-linked outer membrane protein [Parabacteroides goldsteinii]GKG82609.1 SusC/RagA family TonB-linked outer membrane protein [Parabacteroides goldsteinii]